MMFTFARFILVIYALLGIGLVMFYGAENKTPLSLIVYVLLYIVIPLYGAYSIGKKHVTGVVACLIFFMSQSIRRIGGESELAFKAPFSLGIPFGDFSDGQGYLFDCFAIFIGVLLALLAWKICKAKQTL
ncbi:hypothetical protein HR060_11715 [Catenovulum sp. SM1970]|uniref:hypothetical protein n=1 Tax=Marinifaba aquimaris TaxID=2741323 RepID=UPI001574B88B|nr:hypothetical protein [Marinifaba aquimaris]NTS77530.1 hypothetical protein [Marinifaba aquimaris]